MPRKFDRTTVATAEGYAGRFERRPEFELFGDLIPAVVDASTVRQRTVDDLRVFRIPDVFAGRDEVFIGFGKPNAYLVVPDGKGGYQKFAGKSLKRTPSTIEDTREFVQSGILVRFKNVPAPAAEKLRQAMKVFHGRKFWTCVNACMRVMQEAGFTSGAKPLSKRYWPYSLFRSLLRDGLTFDGKPVEFEIIRTTPVRLDRYGFQLVKAEAATFCRHADRSLEKRARKSKIAAWLRSLIKAPARLIGGKKEALRTTGPVAPALPHDQDYACDIHVKVSRTSFVGTILRQLWGPHTLFEACQDRVALADYLPETLKAFPQAKPSLATRLKKRVLFSRPVIKLIRWVLAPAYVDIGSRTECDIYDMLRTHSEQAPNKYNLVMTQSSIIIARITVGAKLVDWILSKHVLMSGYNPLVGFAGEVWKDSEGVIHVSRNSGTYRPTEEQLDAAVAFLQAVFPHLRFVKD